MMMNDEDGLPLGWLVMRPQWSSIQSALEHDYSVKVEWVSLMRYDCCSH